MLSLPLVSFIVTSYNYAGFIGRTLESIKAQSYKNFEIIVVDDASSDNSTEIIERFIEHNQDIRILFIKHERNKGQLAAFLTGLEKAQGQFVSFVDSDDILVKEFTEAHLRVHLAASAAFTSSEIVEIGRNDEIHTIHSPYSPHKDEAAEIKNLKELLNIDIENISYKILNTKNAPFGGWYWSPTSSAMFRKSSIEVLINYKNTDKWRICPDKFVFNFAHLTGGSAIIFAPLAAVRRHGANAGGGQLICGDKKFHSDKTTANNIKNNLKIRPETVKFILQNKKHFGMRNALSLIFRIFIPIN